MRGGASPHPRAAPASAFYFPLPSWDDEAPPVYSGAAGCLPARGRERVNRDREQEVEHDEEDRANTLSVPNLTLLREDALEPRRKAELNQLLNDLDADEADDLRLTMEQAQARAKDLAAEKEQLEAQAAALARVVAEQEGLLR
ncbi:MAG TPA: hypothetical protein VK459_11065 [Polyangiaceae bacterium]|nr:hypothetical protein [Polyangiaceae bacterium]